MLAFRWYVIPDFVSLCAINRGTFILNSTNPEVVYKDGVAVGVLAGPPDAREAASAPLVIGDPSYFPPEKSRRTGRVRGGW